MSESIISRGFLGLSANQNGLKKTSDAFLKDKSGVGLTFDTGKYVTLKGFEQIFSDVLKDINEKKPVQVPGGKSLSTDTSSGLLGISQYFSTLDGMKTTLNKVADMGLDAINTSLTSHKI